VNRGLNERAAIAAIDAGLRELARQGAVVLPAYCDFCGAMHHPKIPKRCPACGFTL
jgi:predicted Zn-ribbon and HTH transcriptional regulator